ncbi:MAG: DnaB-like helicase C-terminal domain-containing protein [Aeromonas sp.]
MFEKDDGTVDGYCFSCNTYVRHPFGEEKKVGDIPAHQRTGKTKEEIEEEMAFISGLGCMDLKDRRLRKENLEYYGIKIGLSEVDGKTPAFHHYPYTNDGVLKSYKTRLIDEKRLWSVGDQREVDLFGWEQAIKSGAKRLIITEGELDAPAGKFIVDHHTPAEYADNKPAFVSLPHGAAAAGRDIARLLPKIRKYFKQVSLAFDQDDAGQAAVEDVCKIAPDFTVIPLPAKDLNDCIKEGVTKAAFKAIQFNAQKVKNSRLVFAEELHEVAKEQAEWGVSWPWQDTTEKTRGIRTGETYYFGAAPKMGKSELVNQIGAHLIGVHKWKIMGAKPEEANKKTYKLMAGKIAGKVFHDPKVEFDEAAYDEAGEILKGNMVLVDIYQHLGWDTLKADIYAGAAWGAKAVFIDPITNLTNGMEAAAANVKLQEIAQELSAIAKDLDIAIFIFCHLRNPDAGPAHERGGKVLSAQFAGSRAMARSCNYMFGLEGDKDPDKPIEERNLRSLVLIEDREFGEVGRTNLYWDHRTTLFNEVR